MILIKSAAEIEKIKKACRIAARVLKELGSKVKAGVSTLELDSLGEGLILKYGALPAFKGYRGYRHATCISVNEQVVHGIPGSYRLQEGDLVAVDVGTIVEGYYGDNAETFSVGKVSSRARKLMLCGREALEAAISKVRPGNHIGDLSHAIEQRAGQDGFAVVRDLYGHGVGKELHEDPLIPNFGNPGEGAEIRPGMVMAIEPMINLGGSRIVTLKDGWTVVTEDKSLSVHFEHTVLAIAEGVEVLTKI